MTDKPNNHYYKENSGGSVNYYKVKVNKPTTLKNAYEAECNDIIEALNMNFAEGNIFKAIWRMAAARQGLSKQHYDGSKYDSEKIVFFANRLLEMIEEDKSNEVREDINSIRVPNFDRTKVSVKEMTWSFYPFKCFNPLTGMKK